MTVAAACLLGWAPIGRLCEGMTSSKSCSYHFIDEHGTAAPIVGTLLVVLLFPQLKLSASRSVAAHICFGLGRPFW